MKTKLANDKHELNFKKDLISLKFYNFTKLVTHINSVWLSLFNERERLLSRTILRLTDQLITLFICGTLITKSNKCNAFK